MGALDDAKAHLKKAKEFLDAAQMNLDAEMFNAATSNAVSSGVNSKDAICLKLTGSTTKAEDHKQAVPELKQAGAKGAELAPTLDRLIGLKNKAQYQTASVARADATKSIERATKLYDAAVEIVTA